MEKILGIDLGTNSIGWAIREIDSTLENQIIDKGVLTFDKGVTEDKSGEHPMVQKRTESRGKRRNYQAEKYRKWELLKTLIQNNMCPLTMDELDEWKHYKKGIGRKYPTTKEWINWLRFDFNGDGKPDFDLLDLDKHESYYAFRALIVDEGKKEVFQKNPHIIGRVLYQMVQRRGYNDIGDIDETEKNELSKTIMKGGGDAGAEGADKIIPYLEKYKTLGAALYYLQQKENVRIRKRYNLRSHFESEIKKICLVQKLVHLEKAFNTAIIWQRPLRSQKGLVGICTFEHNKSRCPINHPLYEEYRTWVFINNLKIKAINEDLCEGIALQEILNTVVYPEFYKAAADFKLSVIENKLKKVGFTITAKFPADTKVNSVQFLYRMRELFGVDWETKIGWIDLKDNKTKNCKYNIEDLWHLHSTKTTNKKTGETASAFLKRFAIEKLELVENNAISFSKISLRQGYATLSINAIKKILPYLQKGFVYSEAIYLANLPAVLGKKGIAETEIQYFGEEFRKIFNEDKIQKKYINTVNELISDQLNGNSYERLGMEENYQLCDVDFKDIEAKLIAVFGNNSLKEMPEIEKRKVTEYVTGKYLAFLQKRIHTKNVFEKTKRLHNKIFNWMQETYDVPKENIKHLWHPSEQETYKPAKEIDGIKYLGSPEPISKGFKNPMALKTLHKLKKLINYLLETKKIDEDTRIVIEIARELNDANKRKAIERWQRDRETQNNIYKEQIITINNECGTSFNENDKNFIDKIRLWEEQNRLCIYTGKTIGLCDILNGSKYDYEHSVPASMSFDNELKNLTIADKTYNQQIKGKRLPTECPNYDSEYTHNGITYKPIIETLQSVFGKIITVDFRVKNKIITKQNFKKIIELEKTYQEWKDKTSEDKEIKDNIIQRRHYIKMELDYWRYKLQTFTITEYKAGWRNSQLRDTQTITKYALPFLKTVFKKVEVQKGNITADFRKIFKIQPRLEKKERTKHSHHDIDAALLTLIPTASVRDKILEKYNDANEYNKGYHELPRQWKTFKTEHILAIEEDILINYLPDYRTLSSTEKKVRKRGKIQFVKQKTADGKWQYKFNLEGKKIPLIAKGNNIRGKLHKESFFGAIKNEDNLMLVERYPISSFTSINDCKHIVDSKIKELVEDELQRRMNNGLSFDKAKLEPIKFHKGNEVIKKVRCKVAAGRGYLTIEKAISIHEHNFKSKYEHKQNVYAQNDTNIFCLYYEGISDNKINRAFRIIGLFELSQLGLKNENDIKNENDYKSIMNGKGKNATEIPIIQILKAGTKCIFYKENIDELKDLNNSELFKRLFRIYKFNEMGTPNLFLQNHLEARRNELLDDGDTIFDSTKSQYRLKIKSDKFKCAIENKDFKINIDGEIKWLF